MKQNKDGSASVRRSKIARNHQTAPNLSKSHHVVSGENQLSVSCYAPDVLVFAKTELSPHFSHTVCGPILHHSTADLL